jgi:hypothetical protein
MSNGLGNAAMGPEREVHQKSKLLEEALIMSTL